jgi:hypothetical protein
VASITSQPVAGASSPCDGPVNRVSVDETFSTIRAGAGNQGGLESTASDFCAALTASATSNQYANLRRSIFNFDTSAIGSTSTITSATFSVVGVAKANGLGSDDIHVCGATPSSTASIPAAAFAQIGSTSFGSIVYASWSTSAYNDFTLNGSGLSNISKTGVSSFALRLSWDINNSFGGVWASGLSTSFNCSFADTTGTASDPKIVVTYTTAGGTTISSTFLMMGV